ncbi:phage terminase small subunit P27 family [Bacillus mobilis]|uniref:Phage terminase small subunit P27 family n=1 Tax=Bacillus mobilis TaxID=2026190 RepID=A0ABV4S4X2_9BACI
MPRNLKSIETKTRHMTKAERETKQIAENKLKNTLPKIKAPTWLDASLKRRFNWYVNQAKELNTLTVLDSSMLARYVVYESRFIELEKAIQENPAIIDGKINPLLVEQRQTHDKLEKIESKLGFNPSDRLRFAVPQEEEIDELESFKDELRNVH